MGETPAGVSGSLPLRRANQRSRRPEITMPPTTRRKPTSLPPVPNRQAVVDAAQLVLGHSRPMRYLRQFSDIYLAAAHETLRDECTRCGEVRRGLEDNEDRREALHDVRVYAGRSAAVTRELRRRGTIT